MRLIELDPRWASQGNALPLRQGMGLSFLCPTHLKHRIVVFFANPIDGQAPMDGQNYLWTREGESFQALTLTPSIDASEGYYEVAGQSSPCWHGFITNGEVR